MERMAFTSPIAVKVGRSCPSASIHQLMPAIALDGTTTRFGLASVPAASASFESAEAHAHSSAVVGPVGRRPRASVVTSARQSIPPTPAEAPEGKLAASRSGRRGSRHARGSGLEPPLLFSSISSTSANVAVLTLPTGTASPAAAAASHASTSALVVSKRAEASSPSCLRFNPARPASAKLLGSATLSPSFVDETRASGALPKSMSASFPGP
mmetsp:Transcript_6644/g.16893  ORF Transcript_6644/g.16893 Transcript_6644/m.16893 type:complete len:212 (+) Transcript_6644:405-1040(+)